jgi:hypothetical protein
MERQFFKLAVLKKKCDREFDLGGNVALLTMNGILFSTGTLRKMINSVLCCGSGSGLDPDSMGWGSSNPNLESG